MRTKDFNQYVVSDYLATGEGRTVITLITRAPAMLDLGDYEVEPYFDETGFHHGIEKTTPEERALREFKEIFGGYLAIGAEVLDRYEFFHRFGNHVPKILYDLTDPESDSYPPAFQWYGHLHLNFS